MNARPRFPLLAALAAAALASAACGGAGDLQTAQTTALVSAPARLLAPEAPAPKAAGRAFRPVVAPGDGLELTEESIAERNEKHKYKIEIRFPQLRGRRGQNADKFNRAVRALAAREARDSRHAYAGTPGRPAARPESSEDFYESLSGRYEFIHFADELVSLRFTLHAQSRGAGHAVQFHRVFNFDLKSGRALRLDDIFKPGAPHLQALAAYSIADLRRQDEEEHRREVARLTAEGRPAAHAGVRTSDAEFRSGAGPEADNYGTWNLAAEGVVVTFAACKVLGCAAGAQEVLVPFASLDAMLNQSSPAARLFARPAR